MMPLRIEKQKLVSFCSGKLKNYVVAKYLHIACIYRPSGENMKSVLLIFLKTLSCLLIIHKRFKSRLLSNICLKLLHLDSYIIYAATYNCSRPATSPMTLETEISSGD